MSQNDLALILNAISVEGYEDVDFRQVDLDVLEWWSFKFTVLQSIAEGKKSSGGSKDCVEHAIASAFAFIFAIIMLVELIVIVECYRRKVNGVQPI